MYKVLETIGDIYLIREYEINSISELESNERNEEIADNGYFEKRNFFEKLVNGSKLEERIPKLMEELKSYEFYKLFYQRQHDADETEWCEMEYTELLVFKKKEVVADEN